MLSLRGPTTTTLPMGFFSPLMEQEAYNYGSWSPSAMQTIHEEQVAEMGNFILGSLWNPYLRTPALEQVGSVASFIRHTNSMASQNCLRYARTGQWPVRNLRNLNTFPKIENAMAHPRYLEQLNFETHSLHQWSRMIAEQMNAEREVADKQLASTHRLQREKWLTTRESACPLLTPCALGHHIAKWPTQNSSQYKRLPLHLLNHLLNIF